MRKIFLLLGLLVCFSGFSQNPDYHRFGARSKYYQPDTLSTTLRDALTPKLGTILYHKDTGVSRWEKWDGTNWIEFGAGASITNLPVYIELTEPYRGWQGVVADEDYIYTFTDRDASFGLENIIQRYDLSGNFVDEKLDAYTGTDSGSNFMSFGSGFIEGDYILTPVYNANGGGISPFESKVARFNKADLTYLDDFDIGTGVAEGIELYEGDYYVCYHDIMVIRRFNSSWVFQEEYALSQPVSVHGGYQSIFYQDGFWYMNYHGANVFGSTYTPGVDKYTFDGTTFTFVENITAPTYGAGQQVYPANNLYYWNDRPSNIVVITPNITPAVKNLVKNNFLNLNIETQGNDDSRHMYFDNYYSGATSSALIFRKARGTKDFPDAILLEDQIGGFSFRGYDDANGFDVSPAGIYAFAAENFTATNRGTNLVFRTADIGSATSTEKVIIHNDGDVEVVFGEVDASNFIGNLNGYAISSSGNRWGVIPTVEASGVMEVGKYIDFHNTDASAGDNDGRLTLTAANDWSFSGPVAGSDPVNDADFVTKGYGDANYRPYSVYVALLTQSGTSAPTATVLENTLGGAVTTGRTGVGTYTLTLGSAFIVGKTICFTTMGAPITGSNTTNEMRAYRQTTNNIIIQTTQNGALIDGNLTTAAIEVRVYP